MTLGARNLRYQASCSCAPPNECLHLRFRVRRGDRRDSALRNLTAGRTVSLPDGGRPGWLSPTAAVPNRKTARSPSREAQAALEDALRDEPHWAGTLTVEAVELDERDVSPN